MYDTTLTHYIDHATLALTRHQEEKQFGGSAVPVEGLLYFGGPQTTVPISLLQDQYLTPKSKVAWQMIKLNARAYQGAAFPSYEELQVLLSDKPFSGEKASTKMVRQTLLLLRLCRWLTFCDTARDSHGRVLGSIYIIHDEPINILDALHFNDDYLRFVERMCEYRDKSVSQVAKAILQNILNDSELQYASHISLMRDRYYNQKQHLSIQTKQRFLDINQLQQLEKTQQDLLTFHTEVSENDRKVSQKIDNLQVSATEVSKNEQTSRTEISDNSLILDRLPYGKSVDQYSTSTNIYNKYSTVLEETLSTFPLSLTAVERQTVTKLAMSLQLELDVFIAVLRETSLRIQQNQNSNNPIKSPLGYLCKLLHGAKQGRFNYFLSKQYQDTPIANHTSQIDPEIKLATSKLSAKQDSSPVALNDRKLAERVSFVQQMRQGLKR
ncbi:hypothetical protein A1D23_12980 [Chelonobacter oris]|uniref:STY4528 family pathogenicity island replication protein n=1 Tax=Chelonobacter oris TaxID=505317 RepID=UPI00244CCFE7|nr:STY4528 family pathogenicity island replication protein [Chelonobacter oris]MDH3001453.1 hypothetical protein [Chelonobacter oris]